MQPVRTMNLAKERFADQTTAKGMEAELEQSAQASRLLENCGHRFMQKSRFHAWLDQQRIVAMEESAQDCAMRGMNLLFEYQPSSQIYTSVCDLRAINVLNGSAF